MRKRMLELMCLAALTHQGSGGGKLPIRYFFKGKVCHTSDSYLSFWTGWEALITIKITICRCALWIRHDM